MKLVRGVLEKLQKAQIYATFSKCDFHKASLDYLGYQILKDGIDMDPGKVWAILE